MELLGWIAWFDNGAGEVKYTSKEYKWTELPKTGLLAVRAIYKEKFSKKHHYSDVFHGHDYTWLEDNEFGQSNVYPTNIVIENIKEGILISDERWEVVYSDLYNERDNNSGMWVTALKI